MLKPLAVLGKTGYNQAWSEIRQRHVFSKRDTFLFRELFRDNTNVNPNVDGYMNDRRSLKSADGVDLWKQRSVSYS